MRYIAVVLAAALTLLYRPALCQDTTETARQMLDRAVGLIGDGAYAEGIALLDQAAALDPASYVYPFEKAYAYFLQDDFPRALELFKKCRRYKDATDTVYKMIGNIEDIQGNPRKALRTYAVGLEKFPMSGLLFFESGITNFRLENYDTARACYEWGIQADPYFPSNYYHAALLNLYNPDSSAYGMVQAEIFINLEPDTHRTIAMSRALYDAYSDYISFVGESERDILIPELYKRLTETTLLFAFPFPTVYDMVLGVGCAGKDRVSLAALNDIRNKFLETWYDQGNGFYTQYSAPLFEYQRTVKEAGHSEAYNYWVLADGDAEASERWRTRNPEKHAAFIEWFNRNPIILH